VCLDQPLPLEVTATARRESAVDQESTQEGLGHGLAVHGRDQDRAALLGLDEPGQNVSEGGGTLGSFRFGFRQEGEEVPLRTRDPANERAVVQDDLRARSPLRPGAGVVRGGGARGGLADCELGGVSRWVWALATRWE